MAALLFRGGTLSKGDKVAVEVGIVANDVVQLGCSGDVEEAGCEFDAQGQARPTPSPLRPFVTLSGQLIVMSGLFESERVVAWLATGADVAAVRVRCSATVISPAAPIKLRFRAADALGTHVVPVLRGADCYVVP